MVDERDGEGTKEPSCTPDDYPPAPLLADPEPDAIRYALKSAL